MCTYKMRGSNGGNHEARATIIHTHISPRIQAYPQVPLPHVCLGEKATQGIHHLQEATVRGCYECGSRPWLPVPGRNPC